jgi:hypothetical protein
MNRRGRAKKPRAGLPPPAAGRLSGPGPHFVEPNSCTPYAVPLALTA